jgi:hypothetical protein
MFNAAFLGLDQWEALCKDHNSYSLNVPVDPDATITSLHCREVSKTSKMLLQSVGSTDGTIKTSGCSISQDGAHGRPSALDRPQERRDRREPRRTVRHRD